MVFKGKGKKNALVLFRGIGFWFGCFALVLKQKENRHNLEYGFEMKRQKNALVLFRGIGFWFGCFALVLKIEEKQTQFRIWA